jgi:Fic family protein
MATDPYFHWSERVLLDLHFDACYFQQGRGPGRWRQGPIYVRGPGAEIVYTAPEAEQVPALMGEVVDWLERGDLDVHVAVRAAMAHLHVVSIHPFRDGNGRVSRIVQSLVLAREGMVAPEFASIEEYLGAHTTEYYAALDEAHGPVYDPSRSARGWLEFCIAAHLQLARARLSEIEAAAVRWNKCEEIIQIRRWPDRLVIALEHALTGSLTNAGYRAEADVSENMARLDFRRLVDAGLIEQRGSGRSTAYVASETLRTMITNADLLRPSSPTYRRINATTTPPVEERPRTYRATVHPSSTSP